MTRPLHPPFDFNRIFHATGNARDPESNVVDMGANKGKFLTVSVLFDNLVTYDVITCVPVIALGRKSGNVGLWHLHNCEESFRLETMMLPALKTWFHDPEQTEIYRFGGKKPYSERLAADIDRVLGAAGYKITDSALFGPNELDVAVTSAHDIFAVESGTRRCLISKPAGQIKLRHGSKWSQSEPVASYADLGRPAAVSNVNLKAVQL